MAVNRTIKKTIKLKKIVQYVAIGALALTSLNAVAEVKSRDKASFFDDVSGNVAIEGRLFTSDPAFEKQSKRWGGVI